MFSPGLGLPMVGNHWSHWLHESDLSQLKAPLLSVLLQNVRMCQMYRASRCCFVCFPFTQPGFTPDIFSVHTCKHLPRGPWGHIHWYWQKVVRIRIADCTFYTIRVSFLGLATNSIFPVILIIRYSQLYMAVIVIKYNYEYELIWVKSGIFLRIWT